ncbi:MAG: hypothetical protein HXX08_11175 [Chloroflexi bacterium]|uniref:Uncharacterized protein n=1 Tax=Candidatus Chlorohelix allophototropha TaxID=3003348 RepID=A0A8T7M2F4_9CHLR|nr:hypothetical protein [Chloroflexota bacterium]WJW65798.1 hypothetical protein OZ401_001577 [Chloroflexota bacterium L227-S17]
MGKKIELPAFPTMFETIPVATASGMVDTYCFYKNNGIAVTQVLGDSNRYVMTHINTGRMMNISFETLELAKKATDTLAPMFDWNAITDAPASSAKLPQEVRDTAQAMLKWEGAKYIKGDYLPQDIEKLDQKEQ